MISGPDISALYLEFTNALTEVLAENSIGPARRGRLARARAAVKKHPDYSEHEYFLAVETAFKQWEAIQNAGGQERKWLHALSRRSLLPCIRLGHTAKNSRIVTTCGDQYKTMPDRILKPQTLPSMKYDAR
jgi:hypothetical protein